MATKLKDLKITKVDFVDTGANPKANVLLKKTKTESQEGVPQEYREKKLRREQRNLNKKAS